MNLLVKLTALLFVSLLFTTTQTTARTLTLEETVTLSHVGQAEISPNGIYVAYTLVNPRIPYIDDDGSHFVSNANIVS